MAGLWCAILALAAILLMPNLASADAIVVTRAMTASTVVEIFIEESSVRVEMEIGEADLAAFHNLYPDELRERMGLEAQPLAERLVRFVHQDFVIRADGGPPLFGRVVEMEGRRRVPRDEITGEPLPAAEDEGEAVIFAVIDYPFSGRPEALSLHPPTAGGAYAAASIGFITYHLGLPVMDFRYLGPEETVDLDWQDPWFSAFRNRNLRRQYDAPLNVFLYVEPYEVRVEIIARPLDVQKWTDVGMADRRTIPVEIQDDVMQQVAVFFADHLDLRIDGESISPALDRVNFLHRTLRTSTVISPPRELDASSATLGIIFVEPRKAYPQEATVTWNLFAPRIQRIPAAATDEVGPLRFFLQPDDNVLWWRNFLKNPSTPTLVNVEAPPAPWTRMLKLAAWLMGICFLGTAFLALREIVTGSASSTRWAAAASLLAVATVLCAAGARSTSVDDEGTTKIVSALLHNVYRAFDFRAEEIIYDTLERSVTGDVLTQTYLETRRGLELASQGGARAKVKAIEMLESIARKDGAGFVTRSTWQVAASVGHWGHIHQRINQYVAEISVQPVDGVWKITKLELLEEERL